MNTKRTLRTLVALLLLSCDAPVAHEAPAQPEVVGLEVAPDERADEPAIDADGWEGEPAPPPEPIKPQPPGFGAVDRYTSHDEACLGVVELEVPADKPAWRRAILAWCEHRSYHASRNGIVKSKVDGTQVHDRDRPTAWRFYENAVVDGTLDPAGCIWHQVNRKIRHEPKCRSLKKDWPYNSPKMSEQLGNEWLRHPHDMERFGARGPHDHNANAYRTIPGCWDPQQLERFDVATTVTVRASLKICECWGCSTKRDIRAHWGRRSMPCPR